MPDQPPPSSTWIRSLFVRFKATYGNRVATMWGDSSPAVTESVWAEELAGFAQEDVKAALEACRTSYPSFPPTLFEFAGLCRDAKHRRASKVAKLGDRGVRVPPPAHVRAQLREFMAKHTIRR